MTGLKWSRRTTEKIANELGSIGIQVSPSTVSRVLKSMGFSLRSNRKSISDATSPERNEQFEYIEYLRECFVQDGTPHHQRRYKKEGVGWSVQKSRKHLGTAVDSGE